MTNLVGAMMRYNTMTNLVGAMMRYNTMMLCKRSNTVKVGELRFDMVFPMDWNTQDRLAFTELVGRNLEIILRHALLVEAIP